MREAAIARFTQCMAHLNDALRKITTAYVVEPPRAFLPSFERCMLDTYLGRRQRAAHEAITCLNPRLAPWERLRSADVAALIVGAYFDEPQLVHDMLVERRAVIAAAQIAEVEAAKQRIARRRALGALAA
jgi:hypothetical protein